MKYKVTLFVLVAVTIVSANLFVQSAVAEQTEVYTGIKAEDVLPTAGAGTIMK